MSLERIIKEYYELNKNPIINCGITIGLVNDGSFKDWRVSMQGPKDSPYRSGIFVLNVSFPDNYPNEPPEIYFITPIYHLNINPQAPKNEGDEFDKLGHVSISTLNWWNPKYKMREVLHNIYSLFYFANPDSPYGIDRAREYIEDTNTFYEKAKYFTKKYAKSDFNINYDRTKDWDFNI